MSRFYAITNTVVIIAVILWNYIANASGINGNTVGSLSDEYYDLFTPADYAFSIWSIIYLALVAHGIFQIKKAFGERHQVDFILKIGPWLIIANLANALWLFFWLNENTATSIVLMFLILISLIMIIIKLNMERWKAPTPIIVFVWWPICLYSGWISVATIANIAAWLSKIGWQPLFNEITWTLIMICVALLINILMVVRRNMREFAAVGVWAFIAIAVKHWDSLPVIQWTALFSALLLLVVIILNAYKNRKENQFLSTSPH